VIQKIKKGKYKIEIEVQWTVEQLQTGFSIWNLYIYTDICICIYIYIERERERETVKNLQTKFETTKKKEP
jgi:hypothetical protein